MDKEDVDYALGMARKIRLDMQGRRPKAVATGILGLLKKEGKIFYNVNSIAAIIHVNAATVNEVSKQVRRLITKKDNENKVTPI